MFIFVNRHPSYRPLMLPKIIISKLPLINFWWFYLLKYSFQTSCKIIYIFSQMKFFDKRLFLKCFSSLFWNFWFFFENYRSANLIFKNWFMSVLIKLNVFETVISTKSDIRFYRCQFLVRDFDKYYHSKVINVYFW